jgi:hypothetical protein
LDWAKIGYNSEKPFNNVKLIDKTTRKKKFSTH